MQQGITWLEVCVLSANFTKYDKPSQFKTAHLQRFVVIKYFSFDYFQANFKNKSSVWNEITKSNLD
jgi:hypothetical protein